MPREPLVSIIVLTYKNFDFFKYCFDSILSQNYTNIEIVISDDASPNLDKLMLIDYIENNNRGNIKNVIFNINEKNMGVVRNKNKAISLSSGKYIVPVYLDDALYDENSLCNIVNFFSEKNCLICTGYREIFSEDMMTSKGMYPSDSDIGILEEGDIVKIFRRLCKGNFIAGASTPFSRDFIEKYGYFDEEFMFLEDYPKFLSVIRQGCELHFLAKPILKYRVGGTTTSSGKNEVLKRDFMLTLKKEVLPHKDIAGIFRHRISCFEYNRWRYRMEGNQFKRNLELIRFPDVTIYKFLSKIGLVEDVINN